VTTADFVRHALDWAFVVCLAYMVGIYAFSLVLAVVSARESRSLIAESDGEDYAALAESPFSIPVSVIAPVFNEEVVVAGTVTSLLAVEYPEFQVVVVNDGSTDGTLEVLKQAFQLEPVLVPRQDNVATRLVRAAYRSRADPRLLVIDKVNGGKADALNCGLSYSRYRYLCCVDGDTFYNPDALLRAMRLVVKDPARILGVTSMISVSRHPEAEPRAEKGSVHFDASPILGFQQLDYVRSFLSNRLGWSRLNFMLCSSGAFALWRRDTIIAAGGFSREFSCEDIEINFRIHERFLREKQPYRILALSDMIARTEAPTSAEALIRQRARWQRVVLETVWHYRRMFANRKYGSVGLVGMPYYVFAEALAVVFHALAIVAFIGAAVFGQLEFLSFVYLIAIMALSIGILSVVALMIQDLSFRELEYSTLLRLALLAPFDMFLYRPLIFAAEMKGMFQYLRGSKAWDKYKRNVRPEGHGSIARNGTALGSESK
jgi:cellulose synthase/poly-beta-1,6-N-acetylglucosamine synthase-like glycosyltransferase